MEIGISDFDNISGSNARILLNIRNGLRDKHFSIQIFDVKHKFLQPLNDGLLIEEHMFNSLIFIKTIIRGPIFR